MSHESPPKSLVTHLEKIQAGDVLIGRLKGFEKENEIQLHLDPHVYRILNQHRELLHINDFRSGNHRQEFSSEVFQVLSSVYGECPTDRMGELSPYWEKQDNADTYCEVLVCNIDASHRFNTDICISKKT